MNSNKVEEWLECVADNNCLIRNTYPYPIIRKKHLDYVANREESNGYIICYLTSKQYYKHEIVAMQFIPNTNNYEYVIHKNGNNRDNHIDNLEWSNDWRRMCKEK